MKLQCKCLLSFLFLLIPACKAAETSDPKLETDDRPTPANQNLVDVTDRVNRWVNDIISKSRLEVNPGGSDWTDELKLSYVKNVGKKIADPQPGSGIGIHWKGINLEISALSKLEAIIANGLEEKNNEIFYTKFIDSRYGDNPIGIGKAQFISHMTVQTADHSIAPVIRVGNSLIGLDKIGHFAEEGYWYFLAEKAGLISSPKERWEFGQFMEGDPDLAINLHSKYKKIYGTYCKTCVLFGGFGYFGMTSTGVCSYGDLMANESGYQFFTQLYSQPDTFQFDLRNFESDLWNEEVSPNKYKPGLKVKDSSLVPIL